MWHAWRPPDFLALLARRSLDPGLIWATVGLAVVLLVSAIAVVLVNRWRRQQDDSRGPAGALDYQSLFEQGFLSREELERIRGRLEKAKGSEPSSAAGRAQMGPRENVAEPPSSSPEAPSDDNRPPADPGER